MIVVLHNVRSLHNVGSIFRTSDAVGAEKIYLCGYTPAPFDEYGLPRGPLVKTALGAEKTVAWEKCGQTARLLEKMKREGKAILAVEQSKRSIPYDRLHLSKKQWDKIVLVMGNEIKGVSPAILKSADKILEIPMFGKKESLNVSVAFGIVAYGLRSGIKRRERRKWQAGAKMIE
jgi:23S rRNA (guanosine2251-2'-O)-methyltransferase